MKYKRLGTCSGCGDCCKFLIFPFNIVPEAVKGFLEFYGMRGLTIPKAQHAEDIYLMMFYQKCQHLTEDNRCKIYKNRPQACKIYPTDRHLVELLDCSYRWKEVEE